MIILPEFNPIAVQLGPFHIYWYGVMYLLGFAAAYGLCQSRRQRADVNYRSEQVGDLIFYAALGVILGGRLGYMLFYDFHTLLHHPLTLFMIWHGGMSFHGGLLGVLTSLWIFSKKYQRAFFSVTDFLAPMVPVGLACGRIGNFINGELIGRPTTMPWGVIYPHTDLLVRHPSELYEFLGEGVLLFIILFWFSKKPRATGMVSALFLLGYGIIRFSCEFFREPDMQIGFIAFGWLTKGQLLCIPMIIIGVLLLWFIRNHTPHTITDHKQ